VVLTVGIFEGSLKHKKKEEKIINKRPISPSPIPGINLNFDCNIKAIEKAKKKLKSFIAIN
tara:strand:+ start:34 stop:216 length:183 start_codon:yes stop_codon:yes gene_type:complete